MITLTPEQEAVLKEEYVQWRRDLASAGIGATAPDFDEWWRLRADNAKDNREGK